jgi:hypothetical protein
MFVVVVLLATVLASFTDWLFYDVLIHRFYAAAPELWWPGGRMRIVISQIVGTLATASAVALAWLVHGKPLLVAALLWAAGPLPATLQNLEWMRIHPAIGASHATGWLARLLIATCLAHSLL